MIDIVTDNGIVKVKYQLAVEANQVLQGIDRDKELMILRYWRWNRPGMEQWFAFLTRQVKTDKFSIVNNLDLGMKAGLERINSINGLSVGELAARRNLGLASATFLKLMLNDPKSKDAPVDGFQIPFPI